MMTVFERDMWRMSIRVTRMITHLQQPLAPPFPKDASRVGLYNIARSIFGE